MILGKRSGPEFGPERRLLVGENPFEDGFLGVQAVFRFIPDNRLGTINHFRRHFLATVGGETVHEQCIRCRTMHLVGIHVPVGESFLAAAFSSSKPMLVHTSVVTRCAPSQASAGLSKWVKWL